VREIYVEKSSASTFSTSSDSVVRAGPALSQPPPGLVQADASCGFQFGFFLEMSGRPRMRLFRSTE